MSKTRIETNTFHLYLKHKANSNEIPIDIHVAIQLDITQDRNLKKGNPRSGQEIN